MDLGENPFHFMEIPVLLGLIVFGSVILPSSIVSNYATVLAGFAPIMLLLEVASFLTVVMAAGRSWTPKIVESHDFVKVAVVVALFPPVSPFPPWFSTSFTPISAYRPSLPVLLAAHFVCSSDRLLPNRSRYNHRSSPSSSPTSPTIWSWSPWKGTRPSRSSKGPAHLSSESQKFLKFIEFLFPAATLGKFLHLQGKFYKLSSVLSLIFHLLLQLVSYHCSLISRRDNESDELMIGAFNLVSFQAVLCK